MRKLVLGFLIGLIYSIGMLNALDIEDVANDLDEIVEKANEYARFLDRYADELPYGLAEDFKRVLSRAKSTLNDLEIAMETGRYVGAFIGGGSQEIDSYEFRNDTLKQAQKIGRQLGDLFADVYLYFK